MRNPGINQRKNRKGGRSMLWVCISFILCVTFAIYFSLVVVMMRNSQGQVEVNDHEPAKNANKISSPPKKKTGTGTVTHHCLNPDFKPEHSVGIWTMLSDNLQYTLGAAKMGRGVKRHTQTPHDLIVMEIENKPLGDENWKILEEVGYKRCVVKSIPPPDASKTRPDLREKFGVLHVWAMTVYETVLFIDADTWVQNSLDDLINMDLGGKAIGVTKDIRSRKWVETFNSGVLLLHPSEAEYDRLLKLLRSGMEFEYVMSDQGFLNEVYKDNWHEIGFLNNANLALYRFQREFWDKHQLEDINVIHYTMQKPWKCKPKGPYGPICKLWIDAE